jgi:hypothetical protein
VPTTGNTFVASSMANSIILTGYSFSAEPIDYDISIEPVATDDPLIGLLDFILNRLNLTTTTRTIYYATKLNVLTNENGQSLITRFALMTASGSFVAAAEEYLTDYLQLRNVTSVSPAVTFLQNSGTELSFSTITFYRTIISPCGSTCPIIPSSAQNITIHGQGFGASPSALTVRLVGEFTPTVGDCIVIETSDTKLVCRTTSVLPTGALAATVFRGSRPTIYSDWMIS